MSSSSSSDELRFQIEDYVILVGTLLLSAGCGLYFSLVKNKQTSSSVSEYFLAGRNMGLPLVLLSYFSSYAAGGMGNLAVETYAYGTQLLAFIFTIPFIILFVHYLLVPVFYKLNHISMIKYYEVRFGRTVYIISLIGMIFIMLTMGTANIYVAAVAIQQVSALSLWIAVGSMTIVCVVYSTLGGMRGIVIADAIQAIVMIVSIAFIVIIGTIGSGGLMEVWNINKQYNRIEFFNFNFDPTIRHSFWSTIIGYGLFTASQLSINQSLLQRCLMTPSLKDSQKMATIGSSMTFVYLLVTFAFGIIIFAFFNGCHVIQNGTVQNFNQLIPYFAMVILHNYPCFPGLYFSGILCATLSTVSSNLNSISAIIMTNFMENKSCSTKMTNILCKAFVIIFGGLMMLGILLVDNFHNVAQAAIAFMSVMTGPMFALLCIGIFCPQASRKAATISLLVGITYSFWIVLGNVILSPVSPTPPFATNCTNIRINQTLIDTLKVNQTLTSNEIEKFFPLSKVSHMYNCAQGISITILCFIISSISYSIVNSDKKQRQMPHETVDLIPEWLQHLQLKLSKRLRKILLCDVYDDSSVEQQQQLTKI
ncbi:hypothetical protein CHUAL_002874 [Chamberlinius hualienensis]